MEKPKEDFQESQDAEGDEQESQRLEEKQRDLMEDVDRVAATHNESERVKRNRFFFFVTAKWTLTLLGLSFEAEKAW